MTLRFINPIRNTIVLPALLFLTLSGTANCLTRAGLIAGLKKIPTVLTISRAIAPLWNLVANERLIRTTPTARLSEFEVDYADIPAMATQMNIDAAQTSVYKIDTIGAVGRGFAKNILFVPLKETFGNREKLFMLGHEFSHIAHEHVLKRCLIALIAPIAIRAGLILADRLTQKGLKALKHKFNATANSKINKVLHTIGNVAHVLLRNPFTEFICENRLVTYYERSQEKQADIESALKFNCAADGISFMEQCDKLQTENLGPVKKILQFFDVHPTCAERIAYLKPIAEAQAKKALVA